MATSDIEGKNAACPRKEFLHQVALCGTDTSCTTLSPRNAVTIENHFVEFDLI